MTASPSLTYRQGRPADAVIEHWTVRHREALGTGCDGGGLPRRAPGAPEAIRDGVNGFLLPPGDIGGMAEKIAYLINNPDTIGEMGEQGKRLVEEFDVWKMLKQQENLYADLLKQYEHENTNESVVRRN